jgi:hypothetical protein
MNSLGRARSTSRYNNSLRSISRSLSGNNPVISLCTPAFIYFIISIVIWLATIFTLDFTLLSIIGHLLYVGIVTWILSFLCKNGYTTLAWFILFLPIIMAFVFFVGAAFAIKLVYGTEEKTDEEKK